MDNTAILIGNSHYRSCSTLSSCHNDLIAMRSLLEATSKYGEIEIIEDTDADELKLKMREAIDKAQSKEELFFYFTGHGFQQDDEFFFCATDFNSTRPNQTGLSTDELHRLLRLADADLVVKVIDACNSGILLVKADGAFQSEKNHGFNNLIQISSCRQDQNSFTGDPLSIFTDKFCTAALRKKEGVVYYTDIINTLRDEFSENNDQTPFFVSQFTGRERFVDDAKCLDDIRIQFTARREPSPTSETEGPPTSQTPPDLLTLLEAVEKNAATPEKIQSFVNMFFDNLIKKISSDEYSKFFDLKITEYSDFDEPTTEAFIIRVLSRQNRSDEFVTAKISKERNRSPFHMASTPILLGMFADDQRYREVYDLELNCNMPRVQLKVTLTPKHYVLKQLVVVVTCAPSIEHCYIFEMGTEHNLTDFGEYNDEGNEVVRRWYKLRWSDNTESLAGKITSTIDKIIRDHLMHTKHRLIKDDT